MKRYKQSLLKLRRILPQLQIYPTQKRRKKPNRLEIFLGIGYENTPTDGLILNHKDSKYETLTERILHLNEHTIEKFFRRRTSFEEYTFYLNHLSHDTCFAFLLLFLRAQGEKLQSIPSKWINYINKWKKGEVKTTGSPYESWGCLHSVLSHAYYLVQNQKHGKNTLHHQRFFQGFLACMRLMITMMLKDVHPAKLPEMNDCDEYHQAISFLHYEQQKYLQLLNHATKIQLELPLIHSDRRLLVDALIVTEKSDYMGVMKFFARTDTENTWTKNGFGLMAVYRPEVKGYGTDMVISVDPSLHVHLKDLWEKLEQMEDEAWGNERPSDRPRYPDRSKANEPWFDEDQRYTFIAAPRNGTKLTWEQVISALWELYCPAQFIDVQPYTPEGKGIDTCKVYECSPTIIDEKTPKKLIASIHESEKMESVVFSPTMKRVLAACIARDHTNKLPSLHELPDESEFDFIHLPGGIAIIHANGIYLMDDWDGIPLNFDRYIEEFQVLIDRATTQMNILNRISKQTHNVYEALKSGKRISGRRLDSFNRQITRNKAEISQSIFQTITRPQDRDILLFRNTVEKRWSLISELEKVFKMVSETEKIVNNYSEARTNHIIQMISIYGFPFLLFSAMIEPILSGITDTFPNWEFYGIHIGTLLLYLVFSLIGAWVINKIIKDGDKKMNK